MRFNLLLQDAGIAPADVSLVLHAPEQPTLRRWLPHIAAERPELFDAFQSLHSASAEATLRRRPLAASFVPLSDRRMAFAGLYRIRSIEERPVAEIHADPRFADLAALTGTADAAGAARRAERQPWFHLQPEPALAGLRGRLVIAAPAGRSAVRIAANHDLEVLALSEACALVPPPPAWDAFILTGAELRALPAAWAARLRAWRGIYLIVDEADGGRYVGVAHGPDTLLGCWRSHVCATRRRPPELARRDPARFRFSILEPLSPQAGADEALARAANWKARLHSIAHGLNRR